MVNLILFGPPGSGKGTQAEKIIAKYGLSHISTGDIIRKEVMSGSDFGIKAKAIIERGELLPDEHVIAIISKYIASNKDVKGTIFDGFPRTISQSEAIDTMLKEIDSTVTLVLSLEVEDDVLVERILLRGATSGRADDLNEDIIRNRISVYKEQTSAVKGYYETQGKVIEVNGVGSLEVIFADISKAIDKVL